jgi:hypothetical protein
MPFTPFMPPVGAAENRIKNSSFEAGFDGYEVARVVAIEQDPAGAYLKPVLDTAEKVHGRQSLRIDNPAGDGVKIFVKEVALAAGRTYTFTIWMKASLPAMKVYIDFRGQEDNQPHRGAGTMCQLGPEWTRHAFTYTVPKGHCHYYTELHLNTGHCGAVSPEAGSLWIDALQLEEGVATEYSPRPLELGVERSAPRAYTLSAQEEFPAKFTVRNNTPSPSSLRVVYSVMDEYFGKIVRTGEFPVEAAAESSVETAVANVSPLKRGKFILTANLVDAAGETLDASTLDFAVIDSVRASAPSDGFVVCGQGGIRALAFGVDFKDRQLAPLFGESLEQWFDFNAEAGDRWMRDWGPEMFVWRLMEPAEGEYNWTMTDRFVEEASKRGIKVLPVLGSWWWKHDTPIPWGSDFFPEWAMKKLQFAPGVNRAEAEKGWLVCATPPEELVDWQRFVKACVTRYKGKITHWEILNEPNVNISPEYYTAYLKMMNRIIKEADPDAQVVGLCATGDLGGNIVKFLEDCFKLGALEHCDAVSFHPYGAPLDWSTPVSAEANTAGIRKLVDAYGGEAKELWNTELFYLGKKTANDFFLQHQLKGHEMARRFLIDCAGGVAKSFCVPHDFYMKTTIAPNYWHSAATLSGSLTPSVYFVIYNTLAKHFAGATFVQRISLLGRNQLLVFAKDGAPIAAAWSFDDNDKPSIVTFPGAKGKLDVLDLMGNPREGIEARGDDLVLTLDNSPIYITPGKALAAADFLPLLGKATAQGKTPLELAAQMSFVDGMAAVAVEVTNATPEPIQALLAVAVPGAEFKTVASTEKSTIPAAARKTFYFPIDAPAPWLRAAVVAQAMVGDRIIEKRIETTPRPYAECPRAQRPVTIDGVVRREEWQDAATVAFTGWERVTEGDPAAWRGPADCSAVVYLKHDLENLYIAAQVADDSRGERRSPESAWDGDALEIFLDTAPDEGIAETTYSSRTYQLLLGLPTEKSPEPLLLKRSPIGKGMDLARIAHRCSTHEGGYDVEIAIPWQELDGLQPRKGLVLGFDVAIDDGDTEQAGRRIQLMWAGDSANCVSRKNFGRMILK